MTVTYWASGTACEIAGSAQETFDKDGLKASVQVQVAWGDRHTAKAALYGIAWPYHPGARCNGIGIAPFNAKMLADGQGGTYEDAILTLSFSSRETEDLVEESLEPTVEFITQDHKHYRWTDADGDPLTEKEAPGRQRFSLVLSRTIYKLAPPLNAGLLTLVGYVNDAAYTSELLGLTFALETLLFQPTSISRTITTAGDPACNVALKFAFNPNTWNKYYRAKTGEFEEIWNVETEEVEKQYPTGDFSWALF